MSSISFHRTRRGVLAHFEADQCIGQSLARYGEWAEDEIALLRAYVPEGALVLDVGANVGSHTLAFAEMVGPSGQVIAIEGQPAAFTLLSYNVVANGLADVVTVLPILAGQARGLISCGLESAKENVGAKSFVGEVLGTTAPGNDKLRVLLPLNPLDELGIRKCSFIKIDVEGMELDVLRGARGLISGAKPVIYFEHASGDAELLVAIHQLLGSLDYTLYWHVSNPFNRNNHKGDEVNIFGGNTELNVLAVPAGQAAPAHLPAISDPRAAPVRPSLAEGLPGVAVP